MLPPQVFDPQTYAIIGAAMEVHKRLGSGFLEAVYREALTREFALKKVPHAREVELVINYRDEPLACRYRADFICFDEVIVETKAIKELKNLDRAQVINYLEATKFRRALLINFGAERLECERIVN